MPASAFAIEARETARLVDALLARPAGAARYRAYLARAHEPAARLSLQVAADVFLDAFGNTAQLLDREYGPLLPSLTHVVVLDTAERAAVASVILQPAPVERLKTVVDLARPPWSIPPAETTAALELPPGAATAADLLLLSVRPSHRRRGLAPLLLYAAWVATARLGVTRWTAILDDALLRGLNALSRGAVRPLAGSRTYLGSPGSTPITLRLDPARDGDLLSLAQQVGRAVADRAAFCPRLERAHVAFQALPAPTPAVHPVR